MLYNTNPSRSVRNLKLLLVALRKLEARKGGQRQQGKQPALRKLASVRVVVRRRWGRWIRRRRMLAVVVPSRRRDHGSVLVTIIAEKSEHGG